MSPRLTPAQKTVLQHVQRHPGQRTDDMAMHLGLPIKRLRSVLVSLREHKLIGRQEPLPGQDLVSTWWPETEEENHGSL